MSDDGTGWQDRPDSEATLQALAEQVLEQQRRIAAAKLDGRIGRAQHHKRVFAAIGSLTLSDAIPPALRSGPFAAPFERRPVAVRISNGQPCPFSDHDPDVRGVALKFWSPQGIEADLLMTNQGGRSHARDAQEFMAIADVLVARIEGGGAAALQELRHELQGHHLTLAEALRIGAQLLRDTTLHKVHSLATETYWGSVVRLGAAAFKHSLHPHPDTPPTSQAVDTGADYLRDDLHNRLQRGAVKWRLAVQLYAAEETTPVNDASVAWKTDPIEIGVLEIPALPTPELEAQIDRLAFNPANGFEPLGITHARREVYAASARHRGVATSEEARRLLAV